MEKKQFDYTSGSVVVEKATKEGKPALKVQVTSDNATLYFGYQYENSRDRAYANFNVHNADVIYRAVRNFAV